MQVVFTWLLQAAVLFMASGRPDWAWAWAYLIVYAALVVAGALLLLPAGSGLIAERSRGTEGGKSWDRALSRLLTLCWLSILAVAGLDERLGSTAGIGTAAQAGSLGVTVLGYGLFLWAMRSNRFFSTTVRIQADRGHVVEAGGPYGLVRHPGYAGMIVLCLATALALGSTLALVPAALSAALFIVRTKLEDDTLLEELAGYRDYAKKVRYRLVPGVW